MYEKTKFFCFDDAKVRRKAELRKSVQRIASFLQQKGIPHIIVTIDPTATRHDTKNASRAGKRF